MDAIPFHPLLIVTNEDMNKIRRACGVEDAQRIRDGLDTIDQWLKKQPHLSEAGSYISRSVMERVFILAKGSVEGTKTRLERMLTSRGLMPELCMNRSADEFQQFRNAVSYIPLPKLHPEDQSRVMVTSFVDGHVDDFTILKYFRYCFMVGEYRINFDYTPSERYIVDLKNLSLGYVAKINPIIVKKAEVLCTEGFGTKVKGIHIINAPSFVDRVVFILKQALREKVASRIHVHNSYADLHKHVPKELLPKDYEGDEPSIEKLSEQWRKVMEGDEAMRLVKKADKLVSDESKRTEANFNEDYLGMPGSFRRLAVD